MKINSKLKGIAIQAAGITVGNIGAGYLAKGVEKLSFIPESVQPYAAPVVNIGAGFLVATKLAKKSPMLESVGVGMAAKGLAQLINAVAPNLGISGFLEYGAQSAVAGDSYYVPAENSVSGGVVQGSPYTTSQSAVAGVSVTPGGRDGTM